MGWHLSAVVILVFAMWTALAFQIGDRYPFGRFEFFSARMDSARRIFARDASGALHDPMDYQGFHCDQPIAPDPSTLDGSEKAPLVYMARHEGPPGGPETLAVLRRTWRFADGEAAPVVTDEPLMTCTASPAPGGWQHFLWQRY